MLNLSKRVKRTSLERVYRVRLDNMRLLCRQYGSAAEVARTLGVTPAHLTHITGETVRRTIGEKQARDIEVKLGLHEGWLDMPHRGA